MSNVAAVQKNETMNPKTFSLFSLQLIIVTVSAAVTIAFPYLQREYETNMAMVVGLAVSSFVWMLLSMLIGPIAVIKTGKMPSAKWMSIRRSFGIWTAFLLLVHLVCLWKYKYDFTYALAVEHGLVSFLVLHAAIGYVILMGLSSNDFSVKLVGFKVWKNFHKGIYFLFPAIVLEGVYQLWRLDSYLVFIVIVSLTAFIVPYLQFKARKIIKNSK